MLRANCSFPLGRGMIVERCFEILNAWQACQEIRAGKDL